MCSVVRQLAEGESVDWENLAVFVDQVSTCAIVPCTDALLILRLLSLSLS